VLDEYGKVIAFFPASVGSEEKTVPNGRFRVNSTAAYPVYHYNPAFKFPEVKSQRGLTFAPGPNNPVGVIWIGLTAQTYGIHGTPEPGEVGKALSHGCIRLTNWDAVALSKMVRRGTRVRIIDSRQPRGQQASNWISEPNFP
jgi:lipoprotein-anchoring transpeptidase ErfK/SrfK